MALRNGRNWGEITQTSSWWPTWQPMVQVLPLCGGLCCLAQGGKSFEKSAQDSFLEEFCVRTWLYAYHICDVCGYACEYIHNFQCYFFLCCICVWMLQKNIRMFSNKKTGWMALHQGLRRVALVWHRWGSEPGGHFIATKHPPGTERSP